MDMSDDIKQIIKDIEDVKIQGATAVAESSFEGIKLYLGGYIDKGVSFDVFMADVEKVGLQMVNARPNEPLARNGLKYLLNTYKTRYPQVREISQAREHLVLIMDEFLDLLANAKSQIAKIGVGNFSDKKGVMTHCHSSTVENVCKGIAEQRGENGFSVVATETRPLFQGRITATNLVDAGLDVKMVVDSAVTSFLVGHWNVPVDVVFIGCDEIAVNGDTVNKVGSYGVALSAYYAGKPVYVVGTLLKLDLSTIYDRTSIEMRDGSEIWPDAPEGLTIINPAFEIIPASFITGFITEFGVIAPEKVERELGKHYDWLW